MSQVSSFHGVSINFLPGVHVYSNLPPYLFFHLTNSRRQSGASLMAQQVKNPPAKQETQETWVWSLGWEETLEEGMATHSSILAWRIPWTEKLGGLQSIGLQRVRQDWRDSIHTHRTDILRSKVILWKRKWQPTPVILPGKYHGQRSLVGYSPKGHKESDTIERLSMELRKNISIYEWIEIYKDVISLLQWKIALIKIVHAVWEAA